MSTAADMLATWRHPRRQMRRRLDGGRREDRALVYFIGACALIFFSRWPALAATPPGDPVPFEARLMAAFFAWLFVAPIALYALAAISHVIARLCGGRGSWFGARMALAWSFFSVAPGWLMAAALAALIGAGLVTDIVSALALGLFVVVWMASLIEAEFTGDGVDI